ncbi:hypothetical protein PYCCODRAFT_1052850 [Trametes coccinea BRFM310]|uniref:Uncharacterized protein n=1 Tax=Trametes coccinea (strain BRFM310) TaxID=1353009 RepID=A0A1Y2IXL8_TRAC3|nr:hypothetical protein PYCCODRAFT_1052850 [Trametes coccinea BRFM310]
MAVAERRSRPAGYRGISAVPGEWEYIRASRFEGPGSGQGERVISGRREDTAAHIYSARIRLDRMHTSSASLADFQWLFRVALRGRNPRSPGCPHTGIGDLDARMMYDVSLFQLAAASQARENTLQCLHTPYERRRACVSQSLRVGYDAPRRAKGTLCVMRIDNANVPPPTEGPVNCPGISSRVSFGLVHRRRDRFGRSYQLPGGKDPRRGCRQQRALTGLRTRRRSPSTEAVQSASNSKQGTRRAAQAPGRAANLSRDSTQLWGATRILAGLVPETKSRGGWFCADRTEQNELRRARGGAGCCSNVFVVERS